MAKRGILHALPLLGLSLIVLLLLFAGVVSPNTGQAIGTAGDWEEVGTGSATGGGISNNSGESGWPEIAINDSGEVFAAWYDKSGGDSEIYVRRWTGSQWVEVGTGSASGEGISSNSGESKAVALAIKPDGKPCAAWRDWSSGSAEIYLRCWNGGQWAEVGSGSANGGGVSNQGDNSTTRYWPSLAIAADGSIYLAWENSDGNDTEIYVARWDGSSWQRLGGNSGNVSNNGSNSWFPALALAPDGKPYVTWQDDSTGSGEIYVRRWDGNSWVEIGSGSASGGGISKNTGHSQAPVLDFDDSGRPTITWIDDTVGNNEVFVRRWNGSNWVEFGSESATGGGISKSTGSSGHAQIATTDSGQPCITWHDRTLGQNEIYVRCWNGKTWQELGSGSAMSGGISKNAGESSLPAIAFGSDNKPYVVWGDNSSGNYEIYVRRYDTTWEQTPTPTSGPPTSAHNAWSFMPVLRGVNPGPTVTPSLTPTPTNTPEPGRLASPTLYDIINNDGDGNFTVGWSTAPDAEFYRLEERKDGGIWQQIYEGSLLNYSRSGLVSGQYCYKVRALNATTDSEWSSEKCTEVKPPTTPTYTPSPSPTSTTEPLTCKFETIGQFKTPGLVHHRMTYLHIPDLIVITGGYFRANDGYCGPSIDCYCDQYDVCYGHSSQIYVYDVNNKSLHLAGQLDVLTSGKIALPMGDDKVLLTGSDTSSDIIIQIDRVPGGFETYYVTREPEWGNVVNAITIDLEKALVVTYLDTVGINHAYIYDMLNGSKTFIGSFSGINLFYGENKRPLRMELEDSKFVFSGDDGWVIIDTETEVISTFRFPELPECDPAYTENGQSCPRPHGMEVIPLNSNEILVTNGYTYPPPGGGDEVIVTNFAFLFDGNGTIKEIYNTLYADVLRLRLQTKNGDAVLINGAYRLRRGVEFPGPPGAEIFDASMGKFTKVDEYVNIHAFGNVLRLEDGSFLVSGGYGEIFSPYEGVIPEELTTGGAENIELVTCK